MKRLLPGLYLLFYTLSGRTQTSVIPTPQWRPAYHFTPEKNWTNDPNGLIYLNGEYLLYNQQNPFENKWGHMSWGHARSRDMLHWQHLPIAIPEKIDREKGDTVWIFSGSAVWDKDNTSGFCLNGGCLVAIYTADQPNLKKESQYIAYSNDGGRTYTDYAKNPVIDLNKRDFRDPNVFWHEASHQWVMTVAVPAEHKVRFYGSPNLKDWSLLSEFGPQGYIGANWECPSLIELPVKGTPGATRWVLMNSAVGGQRGVFMQYYVGEFDGRTFINDNATDLVQPVDYGDCFYAAIPWNNLPHDGKVLIGWMIPGKQKTAPWTGQMSISRDLSLKKTENGYRLLQEPAAIVKKARPDPTATREKELQIGESPSPLPLMKAGNAWWMDATWQLGTAQTIGLSIARSTDAAGKVLTETVIGYDRTKHQMYVDKSRSSKTSANPDKERLTIDLPDAGDILRLQVLLDRSSLEIFVNDGEKVLTTCIYPDKDATGCAAFSTGGAAVIKKWMIWDMSKI